ncbi:MAG: DNA repair protein RecO C-terminal domain-containing protein, partial [Sphingomonas bacterium]
WAGSIARFELLLLAELGFGLALDRCVVTGGVDDLAYVSPKSGGAVARAAAAGYEARLLALPPFLREGGEADWRDVLAALDLTGYFLTRNILTDRRAETLGARERLLDRLKRAVA